MANAEIADILAGHIAGLDYRDLPVAVRDTTKKAILDLLAVTLAGSRLGQGCKEVAELALATESQGQSSLIGFGGKTSTLMAALVNGATSHTLDLDDILDEGNAHAGIALIPAALAVAESAGGVSGKEFLTAVAVASELVCRLALCVFRRPGGWEPFSWSLTDVPGFFGATAVAGRLMGLDARQISEAFGIVFNQAAGTVQRSFGPGGMVRGIHAGFPNMGGVLSAQMASKGIGGTREMFEGKAGLLNVYFGGKYDRPTLLDDWGQRFEYTAVSFKAWPSCRFSHVYIEAALSLQKKYGILPGDIQKITVVVGDLTRTLCEPLEKRRRPQMVMEAKYSVPFVVASTLARGYPLIGHFTLEGIQDPATRQLAEKVVPRYDKSLNGPSVPPGIVEIETVAGKVFSERIDIPYGNPKKPISKEDLNSKFRDCAVFSAKPLPEANIDKIVNMVNNLEELADMSELMALLST